MGSRLIDKRLNHATMVGIDKELSRLKSIPTFRNLRAIDRSYDNRECQFISWDIRHARQARKRHDQRIDSIGIIVISDWDAHDKLAVSGHRVY